MQVVGPGSYRFAFSLAALLVVTALQSRPFAASPSELPGEEITEELLRLTVKRDTIGSQRVNARKKDTLSWYDRAALTWETKPLLEQMALEKGTIPMGMGGIFVPRFTEANAEPDIEILSTAGERLRGGPPGVTYSVEPGTYYVTLGSGSHKQRLLRKVDVSESKTTPVMPDWAGLTIETVDSTTIAFRGEYELLRIDEFEPFGRGFGADPELGEKARTWILKPGIYKILGRGEGYNNLRNFITVRLLPGELVNVLLVQRPTDMAIVGGGTVSVSGGRQIASNWKFGLNIGGNIQFTGEADRKSERNALNSVLSLRTGSWVRYNRNPFEWESSLLLDEGISLSETDFDDIITAPDDFRIISLFIYRLLPWLGPYGRSELRTNLMPNRIGLGENGREFCVLNHDSTVNRFSSSTSFRNRPSLCPLKLDVDVGANLDMINLRFLEIKLRGGVGSSFNDYRDRYESTSFITARAQDSAEAARIGRSVVLLPLDATRIFEFGPQGSISGNLRIGRMATANAELRIFAPTLPEMRVSRPDFDLTTTLSWRLARSLTFDYDYTYTLRQPKDIKAQEDFSTHKIYLRFSYSSR